MQTNSAGIRLEIRKGLTSVSEGVMLMSGPRTPEQLAGKQPQEGFITDLSDPDGSQNGFYVRLRGYLGSYTGLVISYAQFYRWATAMCPGSDEFHCDNSRCIKSQLTCDGRDHCGDYSDEKSDLCPQPSNPRTGGGLYAADGNQIKDPASVGGGFVNIVALIAGIILLVLLMLMVTVIFARVYRQRLIRRFRREVADLAHRQSSVMREEVRVGDPGSFRLFTLAAFARARTHIQPIPRSPMLALFRSRRCYGAFYSTRRRASLLRDARDRGQHLRSAPHLRRRPQTSRRPAERPLFRRRPHHRYRASDGAASRRLRLTAQRLYRFRQSHICLRCRGKMALSSLLFCISFCLN